MNISINFIKNSNLIISIKPVSNWIKIVLYTNNGQVNLMNIKTVLTVESVNDSVTRNLLRSIYKSSKFENYIIHHCFLFKSGEDTIDTNRIISVISKAINKKNTDIILFHTGHRFKKNLNSFKEAIRILKIDNAEICFGIQNRNSNDSDYKKILSLLDKNKEIIKIEEQIFERDR